MMNHKERMLPDLSEIQPANSWAPVGCACDCATEAGVNKVTFDSACWPSAIVDNEKMMADGQRAITIADSEHLLRWSKTLSTIFG